MNYNFAEIARRSDPATLKREVNLAAVVLDDGVELEAVGERLVGHCPFHDDEIASFAVWQWEDSGIWACGCFACSPFRNGAASVGDVFDFLQALYGLSFPQSLERAAGYLDREMDLSKLPEMPKKDCGPLPNLEHMLERASRSQSGLLQALLDDRGIAVPAEWLYEEWKVADGQGEVIIPHFDNDGHVRALKCRRWENGWASRSIRGSELSHLYGEWRICAHQWLYLTEGESDCWTVSYMFDGEPVDVIGLPSGAAANPARKDWLDLVAGRDLVLLLDADRAGRASAAKWMTIATQAGADVRVGILPDGSDCTSAGTAAVKRAIRRACE